MTNITKALVVPSATDLLSADNGALIKSTVHKLMRLTTGGRNLNSNQATELAVFCIMTDLNPYNGEAYYLPGGGPIPGVSGYRRKANEYLALTSGVDDRYFVEFREAHPGEAVFDLDAGDIARHATLRIRSVSERHQSTILVTYAKLTGLGMDSEVAWDRAERLAGPEPTWSATAVVDHRESFSRAPGTKGPDDPGTHDKWDRVERCEKRAEKWAIRKAFPSVILPDVDLGGALDLDPTVIDAIVREVEQELLEPTAPRSEAVILEELGFTPAPEQEPNVEAEQVPEPEPEQEKQEAEAEADPEADPEPEQAANVNYVTQFWTVANTLGLDKTAAKSIVDELGGDFKQALQVLKDQHTPKDN
jgi:hypothetical protein